MTENVDLPPISYRGIMIFTIGPYLLPHHAAMDIFLTSSVNLFGSRSTTAPMLDTLLVDSFVPCPYPPRALPCLNLRSLPLPPSPFSSEHRLSPGPLFSDQTLGEVERRHHKYLTRPSLPSVAPLLIYRADGLVTLYPSLSKNF